MRFGILGSGSWATALAKILTENKHEINWLMRSETTIEYFTKRGHNPNYLTSVNFNISLLKFSTDVKTVVANSDVVLIAIPSAYAEDVLSKLDKKDLENKKIVSAIKGILPAENLSTRGLARCKVIALINTRGRPRDKS